MYLIDAKDWTGNKMSTFAALGASNHSEKERHPNDYYATDPKAMELLLEKEQFSKTSGNVRAGEGIFQKFLSSTDIM